MLLRSQNSILCAHVQILGIQNKTFYIIACSDEISAMIMHMEEPVEAVVELVDQEGWPTDGWTANTQN